MGNEFKRNICFSFFEDYRLAAKEIENDFGKEPVADYYNAIIDYALYGKEPNLTGVIKYVWPTTKTTIDKSIERRAVGFGKSNEDKTNAILMYLEQHPGASQREIAKETGISLGKVNSVLKNIHTDSDSNTCSNTCSNSITNTNTSYEREREHPQNNVEAENYSTNNEFFECSSAFTNERSYEHKNEHPNQSSQIEPTKELKRKVIDLFESKNGYNKITELTGLTGKQIYKIVNDYLSSPNDYFYEPPVQKRISYINDTGTENYLEVKDIKEAIETTGHDIEAIEKYLKEIYDDFINNGTDKYVVEKFFKENLKYTIDGGYKGEIIGKPFNGIYEELIIESRINENLKKNDISEFLDDEDIFG